MADNDVLVAEVDADPIEAPNPIADLLNSIEQGEYNSAESQFNDIIGDRLQDALNQQKAKVAAQIYGAQEVADVQAELENDEEDLDDQFDDEEDEEV